MNAKEFKNIPIDKIVEPEWDIRKDTKYDHDRCHHAKFYHVHIQYHSVQFSLTYWENP